MKKNLIKALTTDCDEIQQRCIDFLAEDFAEALDIEGCLEKVEIIYEKQLSDLSDDALWTALMASSRINPVITEALKKSVKIMRQNRKNK